MPSVRISEIMDNPPCESYHQTESPKIQKEKGFADNKYFVNIKTPPALHNTVERVATNKGLHVCVRKLLATEAMCMRQIQGIRS